MNTTLAPPAKKSPSAFQSKTGTAEYKAWVAGAAKQPMKLEVVDLGSLQPEEVEIAVEHCGLPIAPTPQPISFSSYRGFGINE